MSIPYSKDEIDAEIEIRKCENYLKQPLLNSEAKKIPLPASDKKYMQAIVVVTCDVSFNH